MIKNLTLNDVNSIYNLKDWIKNNLNKSKRKDISAENMLIIVNYLKGVVEKSDLPNKLIWIKSLNTLMQRLEIDKNE